MFVFNATDKNAIDVKTGVKLIVIIVSRVEFSRLLPIVIAV